MCEVALYNRLTADSPIIVGISSIDAELWKCLEPRDNFPMDNFLCSSFFEFGVHGTLLGL